MPPCHSGRGYKDCGIMKIFVAVRGKDEEPAGGALS
jgi:hypothetical protein